MSTYEIIMNILSTTVFPLIALFTVIGCTNVKQPTEVQTDAVNQQAQLEQVYAQEAWDNLPVDSRSDEEFFNSID
tara:strand:+ start:92 stop:316 length:225 start_codon:yes stop_codon:yes gene_type:complete